MPYEWIEAEGGNAPKFEIHLWPYRSLPRRGFVWVIGVASAAFTLPLLGLLGHSSLWLFLPILLGTIGILWYFIERSYRDGEILEVLKIWPDRMTLTRHGPRGAFAAWEANPYWVTVHRHETKGPVPDYITLEGDGREVEIGAFLSEEERPLLYKDLIRTMRDIRTSH
ncbi:DUF2244 domain-containing protein [Aliiroseovarius sp. KMU-50]|uniref:DUF2244 domain-containing protein n=1 Tax=Aliiroseovarius salicola TaxID=3009082 RepID=A0ABT4VZ48_9RHOB|nr:DUF2244 domain-containing protein [Aliiroseovarius sp. KMU-50]MDA5093533.1 DUF2244 domain-containing protein [Aliiroseovarius sp. KMU-50]